MTLIDQALETCPASRELLEAADRLRNRRREQERRKKLARRLDAIQQKIGAGVWAEALSLIAGAQAEFPGEPEIERRLEEAREGRRRAECAAIAAEVRQYLADEEPEQAEEVLRRGMESLPEERALEELWKQLEAGKKYREQWRAAQVLFGRRQFREAEDILAPLASRNRPHVQALLQAAREARRAGEKEDAYNKGREEGLALIAQHQWEQAADLFRNLLTLFPGDPILARDLQMAEAGLDSGRANSKASAPEPAAAEAITPDFSEPASVPRAGPGFSVDASPPGSAAPPSRAETRTPDSSEAAPLSRVQRIFGVNASLPAWAETQLRITLRRYMPWAVIAASVLLLVVSATGTFWKLSRNRAQAAAVDPRPVTVNELVTVESQPPKHYAGNYPQPQPQKEVVKPQARTAPAVSRQAFNPRSIATTGAAGNQSPGLPAPLADALSTGQEAPSLPVRPVDVAPPPVALPPSTAPQVPPQTPPKQPATAPDPEVAGPRIKEPSVISHPAPTIPALAVQRGIKGDVKLEATVDGRGKVTDLKVLSGDPILAVAAKNAVREWRYDPGTLNGRPIPMKVQIMISFESRK